MTGVIMLIILMIIIILIQIKNKKIIKTKTWHRAITQGEFGEIVITDIPLNCLRKITEYTTIYM